MATVENAVKKISNEELKSLQETHDDTVRKIFDYYKNVRGCSVLTFAGFLCLDVLPKDLFQEVLIARLEERLNKNGNKKRVNPETPIKVKQEKLEKNTKAYLLRDNIESCKTLVSMMGMIEGKHKISHGLKLRKSYNNLVKR